MTRFDKFLAFVCFLLVVVSLSAQQVVNGYRVLVQIAAASVATPASGFDAIYIDSTTKKLATKDDSGNVTNYGAAGAGGGYAGVNTQTASYILTSSDNQKLVIMNCSSSCTATLYGTPTSTYMATIVSIGSSVASVSLNSLNFNGSSGAPTLNSYRPVAFYSDGTNYFGKAPEVAGTGITLSAASNGFTIASSLSTAASGRFFQLATGASAITIFSSANTTYLYAFVAPYSFTTTHVIYDVTTADNTADDYDLGIYDANGNLVCHLGATAGTTFAPSTGFKTLAWATSGTLTAGNRYEFALTANATTAVLGGLSGGNDQIMPLAHNTASSGGTTSGGALNSSLTLPADTFPTATAIPDFTIY